MAGSEGTIHHRSSPGRWSDLLRGRGRRDIQGWDWGQRRAETPGLRSTCGPRSDRLLKNKKNKRRGLPWWSIGLDFAFQGMGFRIHPWLGN